MMESPFKNDPFAMIYQAFRLLYPDKPCDIWWEPNPNESDAYGATDFLYNGETPQVFIFSNYPVDQQVEILAHELAHVAVGQDHEHDEVWNAAFEAIFQEYNRIGAELFGCGVT